MGLSTDIKDPEVPSETCVLVCAEYCRAMYIFRLSWVKFFKLNASAKLSTKILALVWGDIFEI